MTKKCSKCGIEKSIEEFNKRKASKDGLTSQCSACNRKNLRDHYSRNRQSYLDRNKQSLSQRREWLKRLKESEPCADCGGRFPSVCMDFDHRDPAAKVAGVGDLVKFSLKRMKEEIEKCDLVCANCHRIRTHSGVD